MGNRRALVEYAAGLVGSRSLAEDLVQEAWLRFDSAAEKQFVREPLNYLYRIVRNLALDRKRKTMREDRIFADIDIDLAAAASPDNPATPETQALFRDELRQLERALASLPERSRNAFEMHKFGGAKLREIAEFLGVSLSMAQVLVDDAMEHCKRELGWHSSDMQEKTSARTSKS
jgi:RNA polymerase sigma-70 factor (ECF subfamily)